MGLPTHVTHAPFPSISAWALPRETDSADTQRLPSPSPARTGGSTQLDHDLRECLLDGYAEGTRKVLRTALQHFERFKATCPEREPFFVAPQFAGDLRAALFNEHTLMLFAMYLVRPHAPHAPPRAASTVVGYCSLLRSHVSTSLGFPLVSETPRWKRLTQALRRRYTRERSSQRALRAAHLRRAFCGAFAGDAPDAVNAWALVTTGWHLLARPKELLNLKRSHLSFVDGDEPHAVIRITPLKKRPGQHAVPMLIAPGDGSGADTYRALLRLAHFDPVDAAAAHHTPLFRQHGRPVTAGFVTLMVRRVAATAGEGADAARFSGRSLRIGGATELAAKGVPQLTIQLMGRWDSSIYRAYTRVSRGQALRYSAALSRDDVHDPSLEALFPGYRQASTR